LKLKILSIVLLISLIIFANEINIGDSISSFTANDEIGNLWNLHDNLNQKYLIVYFYPAALTGG